MEAWRFLSSIKRGSRGEVILWFTLVKKGYGLIWLDGGWQIKNEDWMVMFQLISFALFDVETYNVMVYYLKAGECRMYGWVEVWVGGVFWDFEEAKERQWTWHPGFIFCKGKNSLSLRCHAHGLLAKRLMHMAHLSGNTSRVSKSSSDWLNYTGFLGDRFSPHERRKPSCLQLWWSVLIRIN